MKTTLLYRTYLLIIAILFQSIVLMAGTLQGTVKDMNGKEIPFASISVKKTIKGTTANSKGQYSLQLAKGEYIIVCQNIGFKTNEKKIKIEDNSTTLNFVLELFHLNSSHISYFLVNSSGVFAKNERGYRLTSKNKRF